jgi:cytochrome bd-type quinol oxidase subunit 2
MSISSTTTMGDPATDASTKSGYVASAVGAIVGGVVLGGLGLALGLAATSSAEAGDSFEDAIGDIFGALILIAMVTLGGAWLGAVTGCGVALKLRNHARPIVTCVAVAVLLPLATVAVGAASSAVGADEGPAFLAGLAIVAIGTPLLARAITPR